MSAPAAAAPAGDPALIVYDGDCIFCQNYVRFFRLRETVGPVELIDARSGDPRVRQYQRDYDLNEGMLFVHKGQVHYGDEAVHMLAMLSSSSNLFAWANRHLFSHRWIARAAYPLLKAGRRATLKVRGKGLIPADLQAPAPATE
ncbi:DUF393 domain-containing protein [Sphingomonas naphthae]|uniref:DUF393 domain-containing protein n=1 Tax=Sphingomonas naphthae TaxID=1813468 RepID=A0ABY7TI77_9SPHN|nr:DUF393 domain-containing protein [Sphingomonas naphthae]WCT72932.1 DUF393 domain-containing protein [Sphingomonas naphthae]